MVRKRYGHRRHYATFERHNGNVDATGSPTYGVADDWTTVVDAWPCEMIATTGGETLRGRQTVAEARFVLFGDALAVEQVLPSDRCVINGNVFGVFAVDDPGGLRQEMWIQVGIQA